MKIQNIQPSTFGHKAKIRSFDNKKHPFLYNEIINLVKEYRIPANYKTQEIELPSVPVEIYRRLNELKIKFKSK